MKILNTLSGKKEILIVSKNRLLKLFVCGPTVYGYSHIGHARTYVAFDIIAKYLRSQRIKVFYLQNITDVDDKIIERAKQQKKNPFVLARFFEKEYLKDMRQLGVKSINKYARASEFIPQMSKQIKSLIKKGNAYEIKNGGYYFDISTFPEYGKLSRRTIQQAEDAVSRIDQSIKKRNKGDFCLWKIADLHGLDADSRRQNKMKIVGGEPMWNTELGWGRPGWHIEDTAITEYFFGPQYDLHGGADELKFPHHESEIAQQEAASGKKPFVRFWLHTGVLLVKGKKMSKSLGNFITIQNFLKKYSNNVLRFIIASYHYRSPINYSGKLIKQAQGSLATIEEFLQKLIFIKEAGSKNPAPKGRGSLNKIERQKLKPQFKIQKYDNLFKQALDDDFNTPKALAVIFDLISDWQNRIWQLQSSQAEIIIRFINEKLNIFGIKIKPPKIPQKIKQLVRQREKSRVNKQFIQSDALRKKIERLGYKVEDTVFGPMAQRKS